MRGRQGALLLFSVWICAAGPALAARTLTWTQPPEELAAGELDGVAVTNQGRLFLAPRISRLGESLGPGNPVHLWALASDRAGNVYLGSGPDGQIFKVSPMGRRSLFFDTGEKMVTALVFSLDGDLLAGTSPGGRIYRIDPDGGGVLFSETEQRYIWALAVDSAGTLYAGTGEQGAVYQISDQGRAKLFFASAEAHIVTLLPRPAGGLLAGGAGRGLLYQIDDEGNGMVLYDAGLPEVSGILIESDGTLLATVLAPAPRRERRPLVRIRMADEQQVDSDNESVTDLSSRARASYNGIIEGLPEPKEQSKPETRGLLVRIDPDGRETILWRSSEDAPFGLARDKSGQVYFCTGEPAKLYRLEPQGDVALLFSLPEAQATGLLGLADSLYVATSNPAALHRTAAGLAETGVYVSPILDALGPARWGTIRWKLEGSTNGVELYTRTGNSDLPDGTWSAWSPALTNQRGSAIINPTGRYFQWRARFTGVSWAGARLHSVTVRYQPLNRPPVLRELLLDGPRNAVSAAATFRWSDYDPDQDQVEVQLQYRPLGSPDWIDLRRPEGVAPEAEQAEGSAEQGRSGSEWYEDRIVWHTQELAEGEYEVRALASDSPSNAPGEERTAISERSLRFIVDRSPPAIEVNAALSDAVEIRVSDAHSDIERLEVLLNGRTRFTLRPLDGLCDSPQETFKFKFGDDLASGDWSVKGVDSAENAREVALPRPGRSES